MKLAKEDRPKLIVLGVLIAVLCGWVTYSLVGRKAAASSEPQPPSVREAAVNNAKTTTPPRVQIPAGKPEKAGPAKTPVMVAQLPVEESVSQKDPFMACIREPVACGGTTASRRPVRIPGFASKLPPFRLSPGPMQFGMRQQDGLSPLSATAAPADPQFVLTGIINGSTDVAIIRAGDAGRHIVKTGQFIDGKYFVKFIGRDRVVLTNGTRSIDLRLGGGKNAS